MMDRRPLLPPPPPHYKKNTHKPTNDKQTKWQDELLQVALARWLLEYWTQPTDFSWEDFLPMMQVRLLLLGQIKS
jgi:hypothetical protein